MSSDALSTSDRNREAWGPAACALLGAWLLGSPPALGYQGGSMAWNDFACGVIAIALSIVALRSRRAVPVAEWLLCLLGIWMLHAPLVFHTPAAAAYLNGTVVGVGLIVFSVVLPRSRWRRQACDPEIPHGWTFNPSSWAQRMPIIALAWINFLLARYLAAYQFDHIDWPGDPFFSDGTQRVLDSEISEAFPISDAGLGAAAYMIEALIGFMGTAGRWRTAPWTVALFGILVIPVGVVSTVLMILQPVAVGAWCTICLITAALMIVMATLALPEVIAMLQYLARCRRDRRNVWTVFWKGGDDEGGSPDEPHAYLTSPLTVLLRAMVYGTTMPWTLVSGVFIGIWFVAAPDILGIAERAAEAHIVGGALVIVISILAMSEPARALRLLNIIVALALAVAVWISDGAETPLRITATILTIILILLMLPRGRIQQRYGTWQRLIG